MTNTKPNRQTLDDHDLEAVAGGVPTPWGPRPSHTEQAVQNGTQSQSGHFGEAFHPIYVGPCPNPDANG